MLSPTEGPLRKAYSTLTVAEGLLPMTAEMSALKPESLRRLKPMLKAAESMVLVSNRSPKPNWWMGPRLQWKARVKGSLSP